jgi:hypothetical protein
MNLDTCLRPLIWVRMECLRWTHWRPFVRAARHPRETQERLLLRIIDRNRDTHFGRQHGFAAIGCYGDFAAAVPVQDYETLRPFIEEQQRTKLPALNRDQPVMFAQTSGTTGKPKLIPLLADCVRNHARQQAIQSFVLFSLEPTAFYGRILGIVSPAVEGTLDCGTPYGSASGHVSRTMPRLAKSRYVLPEEVLSIGDYDLKYLVILRLAVVHQDLTFIATANPSTLLKLLSLAGEHREWLLDDLRHGTFRHRNRLTAQQWAAIEPYLACGPDRVRQLEATWPSAKPSLSDLWPNLRLISTWTGGNCAIALEVVKKGLAPKVRIVELGYLASELRATITVRTDNAGMPTIQENFFEFVERSNWEQERKEFLTVDALEEGKQYYIVVTTGAGLYRYFLNDLISVSGRFEATPTIRFLQKGKGVTNITGEKLYESQVVQAVAALEQELGLGLDFFMVLADAEGAVYRLVVEGPSVAEGTSQRLIEVVERKLSELNVEYAQKRASGRLHCLQLLAVAPGTGEAYKRSRMAKGQREGQFKIIALQYQSECEFPFEEYSLKGENSR